MRIIAYIAMPGLPRTEKPRPIRTGRVERGFQVFALRRSGAVKLLQGYGATNGFNVSLGLVGIFLLGAFEQD